MMTDRVLSCECVADLMGLIEMCPQLLNSTHKAPAGPSCLIASETTNVI